MSGPLIPPGQRPGLTPPGVKTEELEPIEAPHGEEVEEDELGKAARAGLSTSEGRRERPLPKQAVPGARLLEVEGLKTHFTLESGSVKAVDGVSFTLDYGEALGIAGESGCGKTTTALSLVRILPGNAKIVDGSVRLMGIELTGKTEDAMRRYRWREISIVFQGAMNALNPVQRVREQIAEPIEQRLGESSKASLARADELLELVGIPKKRGRAYPHELSGGMRQRAMIAMALACDPAIVIGDEPTTALDVMVQAQILRLLEELRAKLGLSLILITHDLSVIAETCDKVLIMYAGRVAEEGPVSEVFRRPRHPYTQRLLAAFPNIAADRRTLEVIPGLPPDLRDPPPGCRFAPRCFAAMEVCSEVVPPELTFDGVRVACHLYTADGDGTPVTTAPPNAVAAQAGPGGTGGRGGRAPGSGPGRDRPMTDELLRLTGLKVHFPVRGGFLDTVRGTHRGVIRAVDGIDLVLGRGEVLALVGESGSGKTTTGRVVVKLTRQTAGSIVFDGTDVSAAWSSKALGDYRRRVQIIFQDPYETMNPKQSIFDFVAEPLVVNGIGTKAEREAKVHAALESAGLRPASQFAGRFPHELSGGQRQRVVIAGALVMDPDLIVADEPVSMLDVSIRTELLRLMLDLRKERGLAYLFITHDLSLAWVIADRIAVMYLGKIMEIGPAETVIRSPQNPYTQALVSVSPSPDPPDAGTRARRTILEGETPDAAHVPTGCRFHPRCPVAFDRCTVEEPPLFDLGGGQAAACWLAEPGAVSSQQVASALPPAEAITPSSGASTATTSHPKTAT